MSSEEGCADWRRRWRWVGMGGDGWGWVEIGEIGEMGEMGEIGRDGGDITVSNGQMCTNIRCESGDDRTPEMCWCAPSHSTSTLQFRTLLVSAGAR